MSREDEKIKSVPPYTQRDRVDLVLSYFVQGMSIPTIVQHLREEHGIIVGRDVPYQDISRATAQRWLKYEAPPERDLSNRLNQRYEGLLDAYVPSRGERMTVMEAGARLCAEAIWNIAEAKMVGRALGRKGKGKPNGGVNGTEEKSPKPWGFPVRFTGADGEEIEQDLAELEGEADELDEVDPLPMVIEIRIGFSGGYTMAQTAHDLGYAIGDQVEDWEKKLKKLVFEVIKEAGRGDLLPEGRVKRRFKVALKFVFVNLVSGFDPEPHTNPIAFLTAFLNDEVLASRTAVKIFNGMPFVEIGKGRDIIQEIEALWSVRRYYEENGFDIILTSGSSISDRHSTFRRYYHDRQLTNLLVERGVEGDYNWLPLTDRNPFSLRELKEGLTGELATLLKYRPMTLLTLEDLAEHVEEERDVFFILAPCAHCLEEKSKIAKAVLGQKRSIATHLVVDRESAEGILEDGE